MCMLDGAASRRQELMEQLPQGGREGGRKFSVTLNLIIYALMTPLVQ